MSTTDQPDQPEGFSEQMYTKEAVDVKQKLSKLPLHNQWDFYHIDPTQIAKGIWEPSLISTFGTIYDFWCIFNNIAGPSYLPYNTFLYMFRHGIAPKWENEENKYGGEMSVIFDLKQADLADDAWLHTVLATVGEYFTQSDSINGLCCSAKNKFIKLSIWVNKADPAVTSSIIEEWTKNLNTPPTDVKFKAFK